MTITDLQNQVKQDLKLNGDQLNFDAVMTPDIHNTYNRMLMAEKLALRKLQAEWDRLYLQRWEYYKKRADPEVYLEKPLLKKIMDTDVKLYIAADPEMQVLRAKIDLKEELIDFLKRTMDQIAQRVWIIKNSIDFLKYLGNEKGPA